MRLWHESLIRTLDNRQLARLHTVCCKLRSVKWGCDDPAVQYVFKYDPAYLYIYHLRVLSEMITRGVQFNNEWADHRYRGKKLGYDYCFINYEAAYELDKRIPVFPEHDDKYLEECKELLK